MKRRRNLFPDNLAVATLVVAGLLLAVRAWLAAHPGDNPWAPLDLRDEPGWATGRKLVALRGDAEECRAVLARSAVRFETLGAVGEGTCARPDRTVIGKLPFAPNRPVVTCAVGAANAMWVTQGVERAARDIFGHPLGRIEHLGTYSCRRLYSRATGAWSQHATGNAIDIAAFVLADGTRISVLRDWQGEGAKARFLRRVRDAACSSFATVLSPDYNAAHRDHLHLDQQARGLGGVCR